MFGVDFKVRDEELFKALRSLPVDVERRVLGAALKKAGKPIEQGAAQNVSGTSKTIAGAMTTQMRTYKKAVMVLRVGPGSGRQYWTLKRQLNPFTGQISIKFHKPEFTSHLVELGTQKHQIRLPGRKVTVMHPGTPAKPFLNPALEQHDELAIAIFQNTAWKAIERHARRVAKAGGG